MILRFLLVLIAVAGLSIAGCEKEAPPAPQTPTEEAAEAAAEVAEEAAEEAEDMAEAAEETAEAAAEEAEEAAEDM